ncbi:Fe-containing alcohol dehydrogenase [Apiospora arundinis]
MPQETHRPAFAGRDKPSVSYGLPFPLTLLHHASSTFGATRLYVLCSASLARNTSHLTTLTDTLSSKVAGTRVGLKPHTRWSEVLEVVREARDLDVDLLVTLGAGSLTDAAKIVSLALANDATTPEDLESLLPDPAATGANGSNNGRPDHTASKNIKPARVPVVCIPTSLSGGEYSSFAGATKDADGRKYSFSGPAMSPPSLVILDPALVQSTPARVWLSTGVKAVDHCVETLCSLKSDDAADADARHGLTRLVPGLLRCAKDKDGKDEDARLVCQMGAIDAMAAATRGVPLGASHGIGHQLGPAGVSHGETSCILLPAVCKFNYQRDANRERQHAIQKLLWEDKEARAIFEQQGLKQDGSDLGDLLDVFIRTLGMPRTLKEFGIGKDKLAGIAKHSLHDRWVKTNPAPLDEQGVMEILKMVLE